MPAVLFQPAGIRIDVPEGTELLDAAASAGVSIQAPCGGKGTCGKCAVRVIEGTPVVNAEGAKTSGIREGEVLACRTAVGTDDIVVEVPEHRLTEDDHREEMDVSDTLAALLSSDSRKNLSENIPLSLPEPAMDDGISDLERVERELKKSINGFTGNVDFTPKTMRILPDVIREQNLSINANCINEGSILYVADVRSGTSKVNYGLAVDLGTTSVSVRCVDLDEGKILCTMSGYNAQVACGLDVISRIQYGKSRERLDDLKHRALETITRLTGEIISYLNINNEDINCAVVSGNTVMIHLLLGIKAEYLRLSPYTPAVMDIRPMRAKDAGMPINPSGIVYFSPAVGSYVGGDITAGILATGIDSGDAVSMYIDIGTNGELVIGNRDFLLTCACSAGPAFEGGGIGCGMRAARGAVNGVHVDSSSGEPDVTVIDGVKPAGICGSGIMDLMAELFLKGFLDSSGSLRDDTGSPFIRREGRRGFYELAQPEQSAYGSTLRISETDIDNVIRAKAAIYSASQLLLENAGIGFDDLETIYVAGGFGKYLDLKNAITIGLLPDVPEEKFKYLGNASLEGSTMALCSREVLERQKNIAGNMTYINLSDEAEYMDRYTAALFLPHTDFHRFPSVMERIKKN